MNSGYEFPLRRITVNLAPAYLRKVGPAFDLPLAVALLVASGQLEPEAVESCAVVGELSLTGEVRPVRGALAVAEGVRGARAAAARRCRCSRAREAALVPDIEVVGDRVAAGARRDPARRRGAAGACPTALPDAGEPRRPTSPTSAATTGSIPGLEVAAAGGHNLFLQGPPGTGKTMIARRLPSILPPLAPEEAIEVTRIQSVAGLRGARGLVTERPFRAPHHTVSAAGLVGGANPPQPGRGDARPPRRAVPRRALGVRAPEPRSAAPAARGRPRDDRPRPAGDGLPDALHARRRLEPVPVRPRRRALPVLAGRPRPPPPPPLRPAAGPHRHPDARRAPTRRRAAPADRPDVGRGPRARHRGARAPARTASPATPRSCNAQLTSRQIREVGRITPSALRLLGELYDRHSLSARGHTRILRVARTVADLDGADVVGPEHVSIAASLRLDDSHQLAEAA